MKIGKRNHRTLKEFLEEIGIKGRDFVTDNYDGFHKPIPKKQLFTGKDLTFPIVGQQFDEALFVET
ncbi:MAG: hypothetical protein LBT03_01605 [Holosporales bacterium]|jgi:insertion element IS1 protein InsB|nr:hypothetical protein [Holosporales bacterium]